MGSIIVTVLIALWLAVLIPAALAPMFLSRGSSDPNRRQPLPEAMPLADRRRAVPPRPAVKDNLAA